MIVIDHSLVNSSSPAVGPCPQSQEAKDSLSPTAVPTVVKEAKEVILREAAISYLQNKMENGGQKASYGFVTKLVSRQHEAGNTWVTKSLITSYVRRLLKTTRVSYVSRRNEGPPPPVAELIVPVLKENDNISMVSDLTSPSLFGPFVDDVTILSSAIMQGYHVEVCAGNAPVVSGTPTERESCSSTSKDIHCIEILAR